MKKLLTLIFIAHLSSGILFGQKYEDVSLKYYDEGVKAFNKKDYKLADSLFTLSLKKRTHPDTYFNRASARKLMKDMKGYCEDMSKAKEMGDAEAKKKFSKNCVTVDTVFTSVLRDNADKNNYSTMELTKKCIYSPETSYEKISATGDTLESYTIIDNDTIYDKCKEGKLPSYKEGNAALNYFLKQSLKYPETALKARIQGTVYVSFVVDKDGLIKNITPLTYIAGGLTQEAVRVINLIPELVPGTFKDKPVKYKYAIPVKFMLR